MTLKWKHFCLQDRGVTTGAVATSNAGNGHAQLTPDVPQSKYSNENCVCDFCMYLALPESLETNDGAC